MTDYPYNRLKGDPDLLASKARHYASIADAISRSVHALDSVADEDTMKSQSLEKIRETARKVKDDIAKAQDRYRVTADALSEYSGLLRTAQDDAVTAIAEIEEKQGAANTARSTATRAEYAVAFAPETEAATAQTSATQAADAADAADAALRSAHQKWENAKADKDRAAEAARGKINGVVNGEGNKGLNDGWWDNWGATLFQILKTICDIAGVLAIFLAWVPILGQILLVLAAIGAIITLVEAIVKVATGQGTWGDVILAAVGAVLTLFGGKIFAMAAKTFKASIIVKSGLKTSSSLRALQGVKSGQKFMTAKQAQKILNKPITDAFKQPFQRSESMFRLKALTKLPETDPRHLSTMDAIASAAKDAFPKIQFDGLKGLNISTDMIDAYKMAIRYPSLVDLPTAAIGLTATAYNGVKVYQAVGGMVNNATGLNVPGVVNDGAGFLKGNYGAITGLGGSVYKVVTTHQAHN